MKMRSNRIPATGMGECKRGSGDLPGRRRGGEKKNGAAEKKKKKTFVQCWLHEFQHGSEVKRKKAISLLGRKEGKRKRLVRAFGARAVITTRDSPEKESST